jgi:hypothetical protein
VPRGFLPLSPKSTFGSFGPLTQILRLPSSLLLTDSLSFCTGVPLGTKADHPLRLSEDSVCPFSKNVLATPPTC